MDRFIINNTKGKDNEHRDNHDVKALCQQLSNCCDEIVSMKNDIKNLMGEMSLLSKQVAGYYNSFSSFNQYINNEKTVQMSYLSEIKGKLANINLSLANIPDITNGIEKINKIDKIEDIIENIDYNIREAQSSGNDAEYRQVFNKKIAEYEEDLYMKLMRKYVIDTQISLYTQINEQSRNSGADNTLRPVLESIIDKLKTIGIKAHSSKQGDAFDPKYMTTGHYPNIETNDQELEGKVAESVQPSFIWTLPTIRQQSDTMLLKEEEVILYTYVR